MLDSRWVDQRRDCLGRSRCVCTFPCCWLPIRFAARPGDGLARKLLRSSLLVLPAVLVIVTLRVFW